MTETVHNAALLLERVPAIVRNFDENNRKTGLKYNIFKIAGIGEREVILCRVLADLLNPKGLHCRGSLYLELFLDMVVKPLIKKAANFNLSRANISTEYPIDEGRRIDIVLDDGVLFLPIEVKIYAGEQKKQLEDYAAFSRRINVIPGFIPVLFLTPAGYESGEASKDDYVSISFEKHIIPWLLKCLNHEETQKIPSVREIIKQFLRAIKSFCGHMEDEEMSNAIDALISESKDSYAAAKLIHEAFENLYFNEKTYEIFKGKIYDLVKKQLPDAVFIDEGEGDDEWNCIDIPIGNFCKLRVNYDFISLTVELINPKKSISAEAAGQIGKIMSSACGIHNGEWGEGFIWASAIAKYPGLEGIDDDDIYKYELHCIYSKEPQSAADKIVSMAMELRKIQV